MNIDIHLGPADLAAALRCDVAAGLASSPRTLPPKWFYDEPRHWTPEGWAWRIEARLERPSGCHPSGASSPAFWRQAQPASVHRSGRS